MTGFWGPERATAAKAPPFGRLRAGFLAHRTREKWGTGFG